MRVGACMCVYVCMCLCARVRVSLRAPARAIVRVCVRAYLQLFHLHLLVPLLLKRSEQSHELFCAIHARRISTAAKVFDNSIDLVTGLDFSFRVSGLA